jgi:hypothetical protein
MTTMQYNNITFKIVDFKDIKPLPEVDKSASPEQPISTTTKYDYNHAKTNIANIRDAISLFHSSAISEFVLKELEELDKCLVSAWTHMDESIFRLNIAVLYQKRWRGAR